MTEEARVPTRMGDGTFTRLTRSEIRADLVAGSEVAAKRAKVPLLGDDEIDHLLEIYASPLRFIGVDVGEEIVLSCDGTGMKTHATRIQDLQSYEQWMGADLLELCVGDYSLKVVRTILAYEAQYMHDAQLCTLAPLQYGVMPNLGLYSKPDGPCDNWNELLPLGKIPEARAAAEEAVEMAVEDMVKLADSQWEAGADAIDWDTTGASGDPEFLAALRATKIIREKYPDMGVQLGMAGEFVLGMHGQLEFDGKRLAGLWPKEQLEIVTAAGDGTASQIRLLAGERIDAAPYLARHVIVKLVGCAGTGGAVAVDPQLFETPPAGFVLRNDGFPNAIRPLAPTGDTRAAC